ncbi:MAG: chromosome segregation protein SMC [Deltaproteobacteria bacterium]
MKLKKLELFGFKSFYDKTTFEFSDGITAIVGPNGCGKSNIVDAIRWVLGEHAPTYLRSKALEDVIFAGSDAAGPLGMAEVSLTFDNEDGDSPPGYESYPEIQITRKTFRDGESEFSINRVPCRLKDIAELFLDTGAGARGYAIIEQGKIMTVVNAKPDEKRMIIEEAAGVAKFRVRRKEAERKMENTRQNLARVKDILEEVRRQLASLDRQVKKAERYKALREELRDLELRLAAVRMGELSAEGERIAEELSGAEESLRGTRARMAALEAEREAGKIRLAEAERAVADTRAEHAARKEEIARRQAVWEGRVRESRRLRTGIDELRGEIATLEREAEDLALRIDSAGEEGETLRRSLEGNRERFADLSAATEKAEAEFLRVSELAEQAKSDLMVRVTMHSNALSGRESIQRVLEENARTLERLDERLAEAEEAAAETGRALRESAEAEARAADALAQAESRREEAAGALRETGRRLDAAAESRRAADNALAAAASRLSALERVQNRRDWASSGVRAVLHNYSGKGNGSGGAERGIVGVIGELIETDAAYERAVEAVLGERIQSIVVRDHSEGLSALQYLKESREGRGVFVPVTLRSREESVSYVGEEGVVAPLMDVVRAPAECGELVRGLLGGILLVRDLGCALRLWNRNGVWNSYVTLDGDMVTADGILVGGAQEQGESGVLAVKREIRELEEEVSARRREAEELRNEEARLRGEKERIEEELARILARREEAAAALAEATRARAVCGMAAEQARKTALSLAEEREYLRGESRRLSSDFDACESAARLSGEARGEEEERVRLLVAQVEEKRVLLDEARAMLHAAEVEAASLEEKCRSAESHLSEWRESRARRLALIEERKRRIDACEEEIRMIDGTVEEERESIERSAMELAAIQEAVEAKIRESEEVRSRLSLLEESIREARQAETAELDRLSEMRLSAQRVVLDIENLDTRIYQKYEVHPADLPAPEGAGEEVAAWESRAEEVRARMTAIGEVNLASLEEYEELSERHRFLTAQKEDLERSLEDLSRAIQRITRTTRERFLEAFERINGKLQEVFPKLFLGGHASLKLLDEGNVLESGVEIVAQPAGKKMVSLSALSGGEKALTAICLIFSIFLVKPSPFCLLDEADAPLDEANIDRFNAMVREMASDYQFLLITHNKRTMELADRLYGITMEKPGISKVVSVQFQE